MLNKKGAITKSCHPILDLGSQRLNSKVSHNKKGAMFGPFRELRKQSCELFLAKRQSADSQETRGSFKTNRGAMFGLDARIALAIFGALSVISGAALYSAIQKAKTVQAVTSAIEAIKSFEAYYIDTGEVFKESKKGSGLLNVISLVEDPGVAGWNGPYLPYEIFKPDDGVTYPSLNYPLGTNCNDDGTGNMLRFRGVANTNGDGTDYILELNCLNKSTAEGVAKELTGKSLADLLTSNFLSPYDSANKVGFSLINTTTSYRLYKTVMTLK